MDMSSQIASLPDFWASGLMLLVPDNAICELAQVFLVQVAFFSTRPEGACDKIGLGTSLGVRLL